MTRPIELEYWIKIDKDKSGNLVVLSNARGYIPSSGYLNH